jgi:hypothetical protein
MPGGTGVVWIVGGLATFWAVFATVVVPWPGTGVNWFGQHGSPDASLPAGFTRLQFELSQLIPLGVILVIGGIFYALGRKTPGPGGGDHVRGGSEPGPAGRDRPQIRRRCRKPSEERAGASGRLVSPARARGRAAGARGGHR